MKNSVSLLVYSSFCGWGHWCLIQSFHCPRSLVAHNFIEQQSERAEYCYFAFGELSRSVYYLLHKTNVSSSLTVVVKWEAYMLPKRSLFVPLVHEHLREGTRLSAALEKENIQYLRPELRKNYRQFLNKFVSTILSTVAPRSLLGQGLSCFSP